MLFLRDRYDLAFSLGASCTCSESLRRCGFQYYSLPFDWAGCGLPVRHAELAASDLSDFMRVENMEFLDANTEGNQDVYRDRANGIKYYHDFPAGVKIEESLPAVRAKYMRRFERLFHFLSLAHSTLVVITSVPTRPLMTDEELRTVQRILAERFPASGIDLLYIHQDEGPFAPSRVVKVDEHVVRVGFDIRMPPGSNPFITNRKAIIPVLKRFVRSVHDYRTKEEKRAHARHVREETLAKMHAKNGLEYLVNKFNWLMFRHFRNALERRGFDNLPSHRA